MQFHGRFGPSRHRRGDRSCCPPALEVCDGKLQANARLAIDTIVAWYPLRERSVVAESKSVTRGVLMDGRGRLYPPERRRVASSATRVRPGEPG